MPLTFNQIPAAAAAAAAAAGGGGGGTRRGEISKNLMKHMPGEATGFYLVAASFFEAPGAVALGVLFVMALALLILVRVLAEASVWIIVSSVIAFLIWMLVIENGFLAEVLPVPAPWGAILAMFYSAVVTLLASKGIIS